MGSAMAPSSRPSRDKRRRSASSNWFDSPHHFAWPTGIGTPRLTLLSAQPQQIHDEELGRAIASTGCAKLQSSVYLSGSLADQFDDDRSATLTDPFGHQWTIATHIEDVTHEEINRRLAEMMTE